MTAPFGGAPLGAFWPATEHRELPWRIERPGYAEQRVASKEQAAKLIDASQRRIGVAVNTLSGEVAARANGEWTERRKAREPEPAPAEPRRYPWQDYLD